MPDSSPLTPLYLSDLDGTLLSNAAALTDFTRDALNRLIAGGMHFSVATARNTLSGTRVIEGLRLRVPVSLMNGAVCYDTARGEYFAVKGMPGDAYRALAAILRRSQMTGFAYGIQANQLVMYHEPPANFPPPARQYYEKRLREKQSAPYISKLIEVGGLAEIPGERVVHLAIKETYARLHPVRAAIQAIQGLYAPFYKDKYTDFWFIEAASGQASKAAAVADLRAWGGYDRVVGFGDDVNDIPMLQACDEAYAVANAAEEVKRAANGVLASNEEDGVARWLMERRAHEHN